MHIKKRVVITLVSLLMSAGVAQAGTIDRPHLKVCVREDIVRNLIQVRVDFGLEEFIRAFEVFSAQKLCRKDYKLKILPNEKRFRQIRLSNSIRYGFNIRSVEGVTSFVYRAIVIPRPETDA